MNESTLEALVEGANSDIRLILGQLQMVRLSSKALSYDEVKVQAPPFGSCFPAEQSCCAAAAVPRPSAMIKSGYSLGHVRSHGPVFAAVQSLYMALEGLIAGASADTVRNR